MLSITSPSLAALPKAMCRRGCNEKTVCQQDIEGNQKYTGLLSLFQTCVAQNDACVELLLHVPKIDHLKGVCMHKLDKSQCFHNGHFFFLLHYRASTGHGRSITRKSQKKGKREFNARVCTSQTDKKQRKQTKITQNATHTKPANENSQKKVKQIAPLSAPHSISSTMK